MRFLLALLLPTLAVGVHALEGFDEEEHTRDKYVSSAPEELPPQNLIFDRRGNPTLSLKDDKKDSAARKKKKKKGKRKKLTRKPGKRRPKSWNKSKKRRRVKKSASKPPPRDEPEADEPLDAEDDPGGFDYGDVSVDDEKKVAIPGGSGSTFRPSPPQGQ